MAVLQKVAETPDLPDPSLAHRWGLMVCCLIVCCAGFLPHTCSRVAVPEELMIGRQKLRPVTALCSC